ncbi:MAG: type VI secretion system membrane subunit TssM [Acidobacteria bacterium]|nr:type VI secretion system membrane subunit TssM [Acidobacteriota bacterium]
MSWPAQQVKSALGLFALVSVYGVSALLVWFLGEFLGLALTWRIVLTALVLMTWPVAVVVQHYRKSRAGRGPAPANGGRAEAARRQRPDEPPPPKGTYEELTRGAEETVQWLRGTRLSKTRSADAVYALPWFLIAGPPASGKTSLLLNSDLDFHPLPSQRAAEQNLVRPTRHCDWRVTDSAILLDTSGRYQAEGAGADEWAALVETLKQYRKGRPLDGFVIAVSAAALLASDEAQIEQQAKVLRARLDEVMKRTRTRFPVYLVFTGADAIEGFGEFFRTFGRGEQAQAWGTTIPLQRAATAHALFDAEFGYYYNKLLRRRPVQLAAATPREQLRVLKFPGSFRRARKQLGLFATALFRPHPFSESPLWRGFYFTGGVDGTGAGYFTRDLFREVLLRDRDIAACLQSTRRRPHLRSGLLLACTAAFLLVSLAGMIVSFGNNRQLIKEARSREARVRQVRAANANKDSRDAGAAREELASLEELRKTLEVLSRNEREGAPLSYRFGLYAGGELDTLRGTYFNAFEPRFLAPAIKGLENDLRLFVAGAAPPAAAGTSGDAQPASEVEVLGSHYDRLKAYLMLVRPDKVESTFLYNQLKGKWAALSPPDMEDVALRQLDFYSRQADRTGPDVPHPQNDATLVRQVKEKLVAYPIPERVYKEITNDVNGELKRVSLETIPGALEGNILTSSSFVPASYTVEGYRRILDEFESAQKKIGQYDWVMEGVKRDEQSNEVQKKQLVESYYRDYTDQWRKFLQGIKVRGYDDKGDEVKALGIMSDSTSPVDSVLREVARQTNVSSSPSSGLFGWLGGLFGRRATQCADTSVAKEFCPVIEFVAGKAGQQPLSLYRTQLKNVADELKKNDNQLPAIAKAFQSGTDPVKLREARREVGDLLQGGRLNTTPPSKAAADLLRQPLDNLNTQLAGADLRQVEELWQQLSQKAQALEADFPFRDGGNDASVENIARFFNPQDGELTKFFNERLRPYFEDDWSVKRESAELFSPEFVTYLSKVRRLQNALFPGGAQQPKVTYQLSLAKVKDANIKLEIDGVPLVADGFAAAAADKPSLPFEWPGNRTGAAITVMSASGQDVRPKNVGGEWGLLKLFREGGGGGQARQYNLQWSVGVPVRATLEPKSGSIFQRELFTELKAPKSLRAKPQG